MKPIIAPSILAADFSALRDDMNSAAEGGARFFHIDVMDGHFVGNITLGPPVVKCVKPHFGPEHTFDTHLMIENPEAFIPAFAEAMIQTDEDRDKHFLTVHTETTPHLHRALVSIRQAGLRPGVTINPGTPLSALEEALPLVELVLLMSVDPGFGGQAFIPSALDKVYRLRLLALEKGFTFHIEVDGGIKVHNVATAAACGADILVAGSEVFGKRKDGHTPADQMRRLQEAVADINPLEPISPQEAMKRHG